MLGYRRYFKINWLWLTVIQQRNTHLGILAFQKEKIKWNKSWICKTQKVHFILQAWKVLKCKLSSLQSKELKNCISFSCVKLSNCTTNVLLLLEFLISSFRHYKMPTKTAFTYFLPSYITFTIYLLHSVEKREIYSSLKNISSN